MDRAACRGVAIQGEEPDPSIRSSISTDFQWFFDAVNLTNDTGVRYADDPGHPIERETLETRYIMGLRFAY